MAGDHPSLGHVIRDYVRTGTAAMHTVLPARVLAYDHTMQKATVQPVVRWAHADAETGDLVRYVPPPIANVPVQFPGVAWPLLAGDFVTVLIAERSIDEWKTTGAGDTTPQDPRRFDPSDAIALPGLHSFASPLPAAAVDPAAVVLWHRGLDVKLGSSAAVDFVALASLVQAELQEIRTMLALHTHPVTGATAGAPLYVGLPIPEPVGNVAATKVRAE